MFCELFCPLYISTKLRKNFLRSFKVNYSNCVLVNTGCWVCVLLCFLNMKLSVLGSPTSPVETCYCDCASVCFVFGSEYKVVLSEMYHQQCFAFLAKWLNRKVAACALSWGVCLIRVKDGSFEKCITNALPRQKSAIVPSLVLGRVLDQIPSDWSRNCLFVTTVIEGASSSPAYCCAIFHSN